MLGNLTEEFNLNNRIPVVHKYIYRKLLEKDSKLLKNIPMNETRIDRVCIKKFLCRCMVPIEIQNTFLKEMELYGLIKIKGKKTIEIVVK